MAESLATIAPTPFSPWFLSYLTPMLKLQLLLRRHLSLRKMESVRKSLPGVMSAIGVQAMYEEPEPPRNTGYGEPFGSSAAVAPGAPKPGA
jgi:hypothetical protein